MLNFLSRFSVALLILVFSSAALTDECYVTGDTSKNNPSKPAGSKQNPYGTLAAVEADAGCDTIIVVHSGVVLDGGISLRDRQELIGEKGPGQALPIISNTTAANDGHALICEGACTVEGIWLDDVFRSGVYANSGAGDVNVTDSRISNYNTSAENDFLPEAGIFPGFAGVSYYRDADGELKVSDTVIESGQGVGVVSVSYGSASLTAKLTELNLRNIDASTTFWADGINALAAGDSDQTLSLKDSTIEDLTGPTFGFWSVSSDSAKMHATIKDNVMRRIGGTAVTTISADQAEYNSIVANNAITDAPSETGISNVVVGHAKANSEIANNTVTDVRIGIGYFYDIPTSGSPDVQRAVVEKNIINARFGILYDVGPRRGQEGGSDIIDELEIRKNHITINSDWGIRLTNYPDGNYLSTWLVEHNTIVAGPDLGPVGAKGIEVTSFAESSNPATTNVTIRRNKIKLGPGNNGITNFAATGAGDLITGAPPAPPYFPGSNVAVKMERNCIQDTEFGLVVQDILGWGFDNISLDLGSNDSDGHNRFIRTDVDIIFFPPLPIPDFGGEPLSVPNNQVFAQNNYWGGGDAVVIDENGLLGMQGFADLPDTTGFLTQGPADCGSFEPGGMDND